MTDLVCNEIITSPKGDHYRFFSLENTEAEATKICEKLVKSGFQPATFQRKDNKLFEVFTKFTKAEEIIYQIEREHCDNCSPEFKSEYCNEHECKAKSEIEDTEWKEKLGFWSLLDHKLKKIKENAS